MKKITITIEVDTDNSELAYRIRNDLVNAVDSYMDFETEQSVVTSTVTDD